MHGTCPFPHPLLMKDLRQIPHTYLYHMCFISNEESEHHSKHYMIKHRVNIFHILKRIIFKFCFLVEQSIKFTIASTQLKKRTTLSICNLIHKDDKSIIVQICLVQHICPIMISVNSTESCGVMCNNL